MKRIENAIVVGVKLRGMTAWEVGDNLDELEQLLDTAGGRTVKRIVQDKPKPDPGLYVGKGKADELNRLVKNLPADLVLFDDDLSPAQARNLEKVLDSKIIDRSGLILDIFASRARTNEARIQVELAQLLYLLPRLTRRWQHLSRQEGGIGMRGPGETQLEVDRRVVGRRITHLRNQLNRIEKSRATRRKHRHGIFKAALIGYTNSGKSTLLNALTKADAFVEDRLFATLDPLVRSYRLPTGRKALIIDTVGFIRKLPVGLVASFRSTLEESRQADLFLHLIDLSHPHWEGQLEHTEEVLKQLELDKTPQVLIFNKVDRVPDAALIEGLGKQYPEALFISALRKIRIHDIGERIVQFTDVKWVRGNRSFRPDEVELLKSFESEVRILGRSFTNGKIVVDFLSKEPDKTNSDEC